MKIYEKDNYSFVFSRYGVDISGARRPFQRFVGGGKCRVYQLQPIFGRRYLPFQKDRLDVPVNKRVSLRLSAMPGLQYYIISDNWEVSNSGSSVNITSDNGTPYYRFVYQLNVGFAIRLWNR